MSKFLWGLMLAVLPGAFILTILLEVSEVVFKFQTEIGPLTKELAPFFFMAIVVALLLAILEKLGDATDKLKR